MQIVSPRVVELFVFQLPSCRFSSGFPHPFLFPPPPRYLCVFRDLENPCAMSVAKGKKRNYEYLCGCNVAYD